MMWGATMTWGTEKKTGSESKNRFKKNKFIYSEIFIKCHSQQISPASQAIVAPHTSLPSRFKPDLGLLRTFGMDLSTSPGRDSRRPSPCVGPVGIEPHVDHVHVKRLNHYTTRAPWE